VLLKCWLRTYLVGALFNDRGMQNIGISYAMEPGLKAIHADPVALGRARKRHLKHFNCHPFWTPLLVGIFLSLELDIARGHMPPDMLEKVKTTTVYTLSALGDSVFNGSILVMWVLATAGLVAAGHHNAAMALAAVLFTALQVFKLATLVAGFSEGFRFLTRLKRWNLINAGRRVKMVNGILLIGFWYLAWPAPPGWLEWLLGVGLILAGARLVNMALPRVAVVMMVLAGYKALPLLAALWSG
jgi:PTS system mannose-specific IID component